MPFLFYNFTTGDCAGFNSAADDARLCLVLPQALQATEDKSPQADEVSLQTRLNISFHDGGDLIQSILI